VVLATALPAHRWFAEHSRCPPTCRSGVQIRERNDMRRGQSLVVWAIWEGRECARGVDAFLMGHTDLPASPDPF
ncbi:MAG TPA: hypothetical protein VN812_07790, partial [Candidatus Acidoferrales bacterium]|nr:hypothetical protein [Candidatus Acidoferrales bacterium]